MEEEVGLYTQRALSLLCCITQAVFLSLSPCPPWFATSSPHPRAETDKKMAPVFLALAAFTWFPPVARELIAMYQFSIPSVDTASL